MHHKTDRVAGCSQPVDGTRHRTRKASQASDTDFHGTAEDRGDGTIDPRGINYKHIFNVNWEFSRPRREQPDVPRRLGGPERDARSLFLRSIVLCILTATLSAQFTLQQPRSQQPRAGQYGAPEQEPLLHTTVDASPDTAAHIRVAQALYTCSIFLYGAAIVLATLVSAKNNTGGQTPNDAKRISLVHYGRKSLKVASLMNLAAFLLTSTGGVVQHDMMATAKLVVKLAASSILAFYFMDRLA